MLALPEFVAMTAVLFATLAFSIDAMLPAFPKIAAELTPDAVNRAQLIVLAFMLGMGVGTLFTGVLSDTYGRKPIITYGIVLYIIGAGLAYMAQSLELLLAARVIQGLGAAGPRIVAVAMVRDLYEGRRMAQVTSFVMTIFLLVPAIAPTIGTLIITAFGWRYIFVAFIVFALIGVSWLHLRQPETLPASKRRPLNLVMIRQALGEVLSNRLVMIYTAVLTLGFAQLIALITSIQPIYTEVFDKAASFPAWFALSGVLAIIGTIVNAKLVMSVGMRRLAITAYAFQFSLTALVLVATLSGLVPQSMAFGLWFCWTVSLFLLTGLTFGNLNALALQPLGHIAGIGSSVVAAISTIGSVIVSVPIGQSFNGTSIPLLSGTVLCSGVAFILMRLATSETPPAH